MEKEIKNTKNVKALLPKDTANRILIQAMRIFLEKGYHGTSVDDITQAAGLTKGALYWHFRSKEDLLKRIVEVPIIIENFACHLPLWRQNSWEPIMGQSLNLEGSIRNIKNFFPASFFKEKKRRFLRKRLIQILLPSSSSLFMMGF